MTRLTNGTIVTAIDNTSDNESLTGQGYTIRHIETWHEHDQICIVWDTPEIAETELPY